MFCCFFSCFYHSDFSPLSPAFTTATLDMCAGVNAHFIFRLPQIKSNKEWCPNARFIMMYACRLNNEK